MMSKKYTITQEQLRQIEKGHIRRDQVDAGFFDGRFVGRTERDRTKYYRKEKHKKPLN